MNLSSKYLTVAGFFLLLIVSEATFLWINAEPKIEEINTLSPEDLAEEYTRWSAGIESKGAENAYRELQKLYADSHFGKQHTAAHLFGSLLFEKMGNAGVSICDSEFAFGCYHGFFGAAIADRGLNVISELDQACIEKWGEKGLGCPHGIGHGVLAYLGYNKLGEALDACTKLSWRKPIGGCTSGVFMEYNFRNVNHSGAITTRSLEPGDHHLPCTSVEEKFVPACYHEQPDWWEKVYDKDYAKIGKLCSQARTAQGQEACFRGVGNIAAPSANYDIQKTIKVCSKMPFLRGEVLCRSGASWSFFANPVYREKAYRLCGDLAEEERRLCVQKSDLTADR